MKYIFKSNFYRLKKDRFFLISIIFSLILIVFNSYQIISNNELVVTGWNKLRDGLVETQLWEYLFLILLANIINEDFNSGVIKNIFSRGVDRKKYYLGLILTILVILLTLSLANAFLGTLIATLKHGFGTIDNFILSIFAFVLKIIVLLINLCFITTTTIITKNAIQGFISGLLMLNLASILNIGAKIVNVNIPFQKLGISYYTSLIFDFSYDGFQYLLALLVCFIYLIFAICVGLKKIYSQDIK